MVIPARDAAGTIGDVVSGALRQCGRVIVGDDDSADGTAEVARKAGALVIVPPRHRGKGPILRRLFQEAWELGAQAVITLDADGQHDPEDIPRFLDAHARDPQALLVGDRVAGGGRIPGERMVAQRMASTFMAHAAGCRLADSQCGMRLVTRPVAERCPTRSGGFAMETEFLLAAAANGISVRGVPIAARYENGQASQFSPVMDFLSIGSVIMSCIVIRACLEFVGAKGALPVAARLSGAPLLRWSILGMLPLLMPVLLALAWMFPKGFPIFGCTRDGVAKFVGDLVRALGDLIRLPFSRQEGM